VREKVKILVAIGSWVVTPIFYEGANHFRNPRRGVLIKRPYWNIHSVIAVPMAAAANAGEKGNEVGGEHIFCLSLFLPFFCPEITASSSEITASSSDIDPRGHRSRPFWLRYRP
jgi:hypothetical protein